MQGVRFYLEFPSRRAKHKSGKSHTSHAGNVFAAFDQGDGLGAIFYDPNSPVASTGYSREFLQQCKRISERTGTEPNTPRGSGSRH